MTTTLLESAVPARLGRSFRWLVASSWTTNVGDGIALAAGPLLIASQTHDPFLVALGAMLQYLPALLFGLHAGAIADRVDRRLLVALADGSRIVVVGGAGAQRGHRPRQHRGGAGGDVPARHRRDLRRHQRGHLRADAGGQARPRDGERPDHRRRRGGNQLAGPPIGAFLFGLGRAWPFLAQLVCVALGVLLVLRVRLPHLARDEPPGVIRAEIAAGVRWVRGHPAVRTLVLTILIFNVTFGAAWSVLVLYSLDRLHMGEVGFGLLTTAMAAGGVGGTAAYGWLERHVSLGNIMRGGLVIETLTHLVLARDTVPAVALAVMVVFGAHAFVWGTTSQAVRQRAVPLPMQGRVSCVNRIGVTGGIVLGSLRRRR